MDTALGLRRAIPHVKPNLSEQVPYSVPIIFRDLVPYCCHEKQNCITEHFLMPCSFYLRMFCLGINGYFKCQNFMVH